jgi:hypothetical protein
MITRSDLAMLGETRVERFLAHLDRLTGGTEPEFSPVDGSTPELSSVVCIQYVDLPDDGFRTSFTYGLSLADNSLWGKGRPELSISVRSLDARWGLAVAYLAGQLRWQCAFQYGMTIDFGEPITSESAMDSFLVSSPAVVDKSESVVDVGDDRPVNILGMYPVYSTETDFIASRGLEAFWKLDWDPYDVSRPRAI